MATTAGGKHTLNGRGYLAHALEAKLSPLEWVYFSFDPIRDTLDLEPGDFVAWTFPDGRAAQGWIANFIPSEEGRFRLRVLAMPAHLRLDAVIQACGEPLPLDGIPMLPRPAEATSRQSDLPEGHGSPEGPRPVKAFPAGQVMISKS